MSRSFILLALMLTPNISNADVEHIRPNPNKHVLVRCTEFTPNNTPFRYNAQIFSTRNGQIFAEVHQVDKRTSFGRPIFIQPVNSQVVSQDPLKVDYWTNDERFKLLVQVKYKRGASNVDLADPRRVESVERAGLFQGDIVYAMNCFTVQ